MNTESEMRLQEFSSGVKNQINTCSINMKMQNNKQDKTGGMTYDDA